MQTYYSTKPHSPDGQRHEGHRVVPEGVDDLHRDDIAAGRWVGVGGAGHFEVATAARAKGSATHSRRCRHPVRRSSNSQWPNQVRVERALGPWCSARTGCGASGAHRHRSGSTATRIMATGQENPPIEDSPAESLQHRLNERLFEGLFTPVVLDARPLNPPEVPELVEDRCGRRTQLGPFGFQRQTMIEPMAREQLVVSDRAEN